MYARLTIVHVSKENIDKAVELYKDSVVPAAKKQKGFLETVLLVDKNSGKGISIGFWENEGDALASEESQFYQEQLIKFMNYYTAPPIREGYQVLVKESR